MTGKRARPKIDERFMRSFSQRFSYAVGYSGMPPKAIAKAAGVGYETVLSMMRGQRVPSGWTLAKLCPVLGVSADWLLGIGEDDDR